MKFDDEGKPLSETLTDEEAQAFGEFRDRQEKEKLAQIVADSITRTANNVRAANMREWRRCWVRANAEVREWQELMLSYAVSKQRLEELLRDSFWSDEERKEMSVDWEGAVRAIGRCVDGIDRSRGYLKSLKSIKKEIFR